MKSQSFMEKHVVNSEATHPREIIVHDDMFNSSADIPLLHLVNQLLR